MNRLPDNTAFFGILPEWKSIVENFNSYVQLFLRQLRSIVQVIEHCCGIGNSRLQNIIIIWHGNTQPNFFVQTADGPF